MQNTEQPIRSREIEILRAIKGENYRWSEYGRYIKKVRKELIKPELKSVHIGYSD